MKRMRVWIGFLWMALAGSIVAAPVIFCEQPEWDFGAVPDSACLTNRFVLENRGDSSLLITELKSSCGCTTALLPEKQIAPGQSLPVTVIFDPAKREGRQHKVVHVFSNDPKTPTLPLTLSGRVTPQVVILPSALTFLAAASDAPIERTLTLTYDRPVAIQSLTASSPAVTLKRTASASSRSHVIQVLIDPAQLAGRFRAEITISTDHPNVPEQRVPVLGKVKK